MGTYTPVEQERNDKKTEAHTKRLKGLTQLQLDAMEMNQNQEKKMSEGLQERPKQR